MKNIKEAMAVADEGLSDAQKEQKFKNKRVLQKKFRNWLLGIAFSVVPLLAAPISCFIGDGDFCNMLYNIFCDISIMFVGVSFTITALNDFIAICTERDKDGWIWINLLLLLFGAIFYAVVVVEKNDNKDIDMNVIFGMDLSYFVIMFILSAYKYILEIKEVR